MSDIEIFSVAFAEGGVSIDYALSTDVRVGGTAMRMSTLQLSDKHPDYAEDAAPSEAGWRKEADLLAEKVARVKVFAHLIRDDGIVWSPDVAEGIEAAIEGPNE